MKAMSVCVHGHAHVHACLLGSGARAHVAAMKMTSQTILPIHAHEAAEEGDGDDGDEDGGAAVSL